MQIVDARNYLEKISRVLNKSLVEDPKSYHRFLSLNLDHEGNISGWSIEESEIRFSRNGKLGAREYAEYDKTKSKYGFSSFSYHFRSKEPEGLTPFRIDLDRAKGLHYHDYIRGSGKEHFFPEKTRLQIDKSNLFNMLILSMLYLHKEIYPFDDTKNDVYNERLGDL